MYNVAFERKFRKEGRPICRAAYERAGEPLEQTVLTTKTGRTASDIQTGIHHDKG
jgi:hypothetical protein